MGLMYFSVVQRENLELLLSIASRRGIMFTVCYFTLQREVCRLLPCSNGDQKGV